MLTRSPACPQANDPHMDRPVNPVAMMAGLWRQRHLIIQMIRREVVGRYKGSAMGLLWSFIHPVFMLTVYTFVFGFVFKTRVSGVTSTGRTGFAVWLFAGLIVHSLFAEILNRAPGVIVSNVNFVKKVVFPLEILPVVSLGAALFHGLVSLGVLLVAFFAFNMFLPWTVVLAPLVLAPLAVLSMGLAWMLASLGVYLRDVSQTIGVLTMALPFLAPVFYPLSMLPDRLRPWIKLNPLTVIIEQARVVLIEGRLPDWTALGAYMLIAMAVAWAGYAWFQNTRKGFADVL